MTIESVNQMKVQIKQLLSLTFVTLLGVTLYAGSALAQDTSGTPVVTTTVTTAATPTRGEQMLTRFGQDAFNQMVARMTTMHGATVTAQMLAQAATAADCPMQEGTMAPMGMMGQQNMAGRQGMMGQDRGLMGHGSMAQRDMGGMMGGTQQHGSNMMRSSWLPDWAQQGLHDFMGWGMDHFGSHGAANHRN